MDPELSDPLSPCGRTPMRCRRQRLLRLALVASPGDPSPLPGLLTLTSSPSSLCGGAAGPRLVRARPSSHLFLRVQPPSRDLADGVVGAEVSGMGIGR